jgi:hypothetical protein
MRRLPVLLILACACAATQSVPPQSPLRPRVMLISVDGLWAGDLRRAESAGVRLPVFDSLRRAGALADGVVGSFPSVTYPSHATIVTGVSPARHGVYSNRLFTPPTDTTTIEPWYWDASAVRVPTLFDAAHAAGLEVAAMYWPVTAHDSSIDYNVPDSWDPVPGGRSHFTVFRQLGTPWLLDSLGVPADGEISDSLRVAWTRAIVRRWDPDFIALHVIELDGAKHDHGPWGDTVAAVLRDTDRILGRMLTVIRETDRGRRTTVIVTSDHGFLGYRSSFRPGVLLANAGLVTFDSGGRVAAWHAAVLANGGSVMILPRDSADRTLAARVRAAIPDSLVGPGRPIRAVWPRDTISALGGDPRAVWALDLNEGFYASAGYRGPLLAARRGAGGGGHGYDPRRPELHAFFLISGSGVAAGTTLPVIEQTEIAGRIARLLGLSGF